MQIYVHTDSTIDGDSDLTAYVEGQVAAATSRFRYDVTRIEAHFSDQSAGRSTGADIRCRLEARPAGQASVTVTDDADTVGEALQGALHRLTRLLASDEGRREDHHARDSIRGGTDHRR